MAKRPHDGTGAFEPSTKRLMRNLPPLPAISPEYEQAVFTHASASPQQTTDAWTNYEQLEWIGDAALETIASHYIIEKYPYSTPGRLSAIRQRLVQNTTLCDYSIQYGFDKRLKLVMPSNHQPDVVKIYGDVFEAYLGALAMSDRKNGTTIAETWLRKLWQPRMDDIQKEFPVADIQAKTLLANKILTPGIRLDYVPEKSVVVHKGKGFETHHIGIYLTGAGYKNQYLGSGKGKSKAVAGSEAANMALKHSLIPELVAAKKIYVEKKASQELASGKKIYVDTITGERMTQKEVDKADAQQCW